MKTNNIHQAVTDLETLRHALQECEDRFLDIIGLTSEYYWEQDREFRFTRILGSAISPGPRLQAILGKTRWELGGTPLVDGGSWDKHRALLAEGKPFSDFRHKRNDPVVGLIYLSTTGKAVFDQTGQLLGYHGVTRDITRIIREERLLALGNEVTRILAGTDDIPKALRAAMDAICKTEGWTAGQFWKVDPAKDVLQFELGWYAEELALSGAHPQQSPRREFPRGTSMPGWVWQHAQPLWVPDTGKDSRVLNPELLNKRGWRSAFLLPVTSAGEVIGVLGFYAPSIPKPDEHLLQVMGILGSEIGHFHQNSLAFSQLCESEALFHATVELATVCITHVAEDGRFIQVNQATCKLLGYTEAELLQMSFRDISHPDDANLSKDVRARLWAGEIDSFQLEKRYLHKNGRAIWVGLSSTVKRGPTGEPEYDITVFEDITARKETEQALQESEARFRSLIELTSDGYWEQDAELRFSHFAGQDEESLKSLRNRFLGKRNWETNIIVEGEGGWDKMKAVMEARQPFRDVITSTILPDGSQRFTSISGEPIFDGDGRFTGYRGLSRDITEQKQAEARIRHLATHDRLTNLPNREMLSQLMNNAIHTSRRYNRRFAVLFIDLDGFKQVNDILGHKGGDELLVEVTERLKKILRASDVIARLGGDEFVVLVQEIQEENQVAIIANNILGAVKNPFLFMGQECGVTASIGICIYSSESQDELSMMKHADIAMYLAKERGKNNYQFYTGDISSESIARLEMGDSLRHAVEQNEFCLHYQAKVDFNSGSIRGVEALLRWNSPLLGPVAPNQFIPVAEQIGLMVPIGRWVLKTACKQVMDWQQQGLSPVCVAVNLSYSQFSDPYLINDLAGVLSETGIAPELLELEITENIVMNNTELVIEKLVAIKKLGIRIAIANFGTGYTSLAQLKNFSIDTIKVDKSFIHEMPTDRRDKAITEAMITLGKNLGLLVVAEGVESAEQQAFLSQHACDQMQGYYFSKPVDPDEFAAMVLRHQPVPRT